MPRKYVGQVWRFGGLCFRYVLAKLFHEMHETGTVSLLANLNLVCTCQHGVLRAAN